MTVIRVPKPPKRAYNPRRRPGTLLQNQLLHLEWAVRPAAERTSDRLHVRPAKTEAEAAKRIEQLTIQLHQRLNVPALAASQPQPPAEPTTPRRPRAKPRPKRKPTRRQRR